MGIIICEVSTIMCDISTINIKFYLLKVRYHIGTVKLHSIQIYTYKKDPSKKQKTKNQLKLKKHYFGGHSSHGQKICFTFNFFKYHLTRGRIVATYKEGT